MKSIVNGLSPLGFIRLLYLNSQLFINLIIFFTFLYHVFILSILTQCIFSLLLLFGKAITNQVIYFDLRDLHLIFLNTFLLINLFAIMEFLSLFSNQLSNVFSLLELHGPISISLINLIWRFIFLIQIISIYLSYLLFFDFVHVILNFTAFLTFLIIFIT